MTCYDLYHMCDKYGLYCDYNLAESWDNSPLYSIYCWEKGPIGGTWKIRNLITLSFTRLTEMTQTELEEFVMSLAMSSTWE